MEEDINFEEGGVEQNKGIYPGLIIITPHEASSDSLFAGFDDDEDDDQWVDDNHGSYHEIGTNKDVPVGTNQKILVIGEFQEKGIWLCVYYEDANIEEIKKDRTLSEGKKIRISEDELKSWQEKRKAEDIESALILKESENLTRYYLAEFADKVEETVSNKKLQAKKKKTTPLEKDKDTAQAEEKRIIPQEPAE